MSMRYYDTKLGAHAEVTGASGKVGIAGDIVPHYVTASRDGQTVYSWALSGSITANNHAFYLKDTSETKTLYIQSITYSSDTDGIFTANAVSGTAAGTAMAGINWSGGDAAAAIGKTGNVTGLTVLASPSFLRVKGGGPSVMYMVDGAFFLSPGASVSLQCDTTSAVEINLVGWYE